MTPEESASATSTTPGNTPTEIPIPATPTDLPTPTETVVPTPTPSDLPANGKWDTGRPMHDARSAHAVVSTESAIYALAGTDVDGLPVMSVERFDGTNWFEEATLPGQGLNATTASYVDGKIYVIGGFSATSNRPTSDVLVYDIAQKTWGKAASLPSARGGHAAVVMDGRIHVIGGGNSESTLADHSMYDPTTDTWVNLAPLPRDEGSPAAVVFDGKLYAIGGRSGRSDFGDVYIYDPAEDAWTTAPAIEPRGTGGAVVYCDAIYYIGGESQADHTVLDTTLRLDMSSGTWQKAAPMPTGRNFARAVLFGGAVYVVGGSTAFGSSHSSQGTAIVERFQAPCP